MADEAKTDADAPAGAATREQWAAARAPLIIGGIALGSIAWMVLVVLALIAWRITGG